MFGTISRCGIPKSSDVKASFQLCNVSANIDSDVSDIGVKQIAHMGEILRNDNFLKERDLQLVVHSPLLRARQTSEGMLGCVAPMASSSPLSKNQEPKITPPVARVEELEMLREKTPQEWIPTEANRKSLTNRMNEFESWIASQPEQRIAVVGHSQYFKAMLGLKNKFDNCEVFEVEFDPEEQKRKQTLSVEDSRKEEENEENVTNGTRVLPPPWSNLKKLYSCPIQRQENEAGGDN